MTTFHWLKLWNEAPTDPKWLAVADMAGSSPAVAWHTFSAALAYANEQPNRGLSRGSITGFKIEVVAAFCRVAVDEVRRVIQAFRELRLLLGDRLAAWTKRQDEKIPKPLSESTPRMRRMRAKRQGEPDPIFERDNYSCRYCGSARGPLQIDHIYPRCKGGGNEPDNLATCCPTCNASKGDMTLDEWKASGTMPEKPRSTERVRKFRERKAASKAQVSFQFKEQETSVSCVTSSAEEEGVAQRIESSNTTTTELLAAREGDKGDKGDSFGRKAPFGDAEPPSNVFVLPTGEQVFRVLEGPAIKAHRKELRRQKVMRFIKATSSGGDLERRIEGMLGLDGVHDEQWWFDKCDAERRLANWDDMRETRDTRRSFG